MKLNNKGFALTSMIYMLLVLFLMIMLLLLANLAQRKVVLDKIKHDVINKLDQGTSINTQELPYQNQTTGIYYETLELALMKANTTDTIKVMKNVTDVSTPVVDENKDIKIDLAGNEITLSKKFTNNGTLDIYSSADGGTITSPVNAAITNKGTLTVNGTSNEHTLFINGSSTTRQSTYSIINSYQDAITTINDNVTIKYINKSTSGTGNRYVITNAGTLTINGATIINNMDETENENGISNTSTATNASIIMNSGTIDTGGVAIWNNGSTKSTIEDPAIKVTGGTIKSSGNYAINNGKAGSMIYITGGEIYSTGATTIQTNGNLNMTGGTVYDYNGVGINTTSSSNTIVSGGLIKKAINPVTNEWIGGATFQINNTANATITGNAVIQNDTGSPSNVIYNNGTGTLTVEGNALIENKAAVVAGTNNSYGKIVVNSGTIKSAGSVALSNNYTSSTSTKYGTIEINGGLLSTTASQTIRNLSAYGEIKITGGTITATGTSSSYGTIHNTKANTKIIIEGGTITKPNASYAICIASGSDNTNTTITGGDISTGGATAVYNRGNGSTVIVGTEGAESNTYPKLTGRILGEVVSTGSGPITVHSGTITSTTSTAISSVNDITINGGEISATSASAVYATAAAKITINGGNISSNNLVVASNDTSAATIEINGGTMTRTSGTAAAIQTKIGTTVIKGGTINSTGYAVYATTGSITIGEDDGNVSTTSPSITGLNGVGKSTGSINFYDGVIVGTNGSGSSITSSYVQPNGYNVFTTLDGTTETSILKGDYAINVDPNGGTYKGTSNISGYTANSGTTIDISNPTRTGYTFEGWLPTKEAYDATWVEVFYHNNRTGTVLFSNANDWAEAKSTDSEDKYSILGQLEKFRTNTSQKFEFLLEYDNSSLSGKYNRWKQSANPLETSIANGTATADIVSALGYEDVHIDWTGNSWKGMAKSTSTSTFIDGSPGNSNWWYAIGAKGVYQGGIPGVNSVVVTDGLHLWVKANSDLSNITSAVTGVADNETYTAKHDITLKAIWISN